MQPIQPYSLTQNYTYPIIPLQNQIPNRTTYPKITQLPTITQPLSGLVSPTAIPYPTPIPVPTPISVPPLAGITAYPINKSISVPNNNPLCGEELDKVQKDLYDKKQFSALAKMGSNWNYENLYEKIKDNQDFNELINSKFYQGHNGFINILETMRSLDEQRNKKIGNPFAGLPFNGIVTGPSRYEKYDIPDYLKMLNEFVKSPKYSDDLKAYYIATEGKKLDSYYGNLDTISKVTQPLDALKTTQQ